MLLVKAVNNTVQQYPYSIGLLRKDNPNTSFPKKVSVSDMAAFNAYPVTEVTPTVTATQKLVKTWTPTLVEGEWVLAHAAVDLSTEDIAEATDVLAANAREKRDGLLVSTDWTAGSDVTMSAAMTAYRQALRDVTSQVGFPSGITWPSKPQGAL
tara:strand:- start:57 stop:518 length:462 start_codon:yes stop_codon:yes gene_type:complete